MLSLCAKMFRKWCLFQVVIEIFHSSLVTVRFSVVMNDVCSDESIY